MFVYAGYGFVVLAGIIALAAQIFVQRSYSQYSQVDTLENITGAEVARRILNLKGISDVQVVTSSGGELSDHYDPTKKIVALSPKVYSETSIASVSVAAHEVGHAIQHAEGYAFIGLRNKVLPAAIIASKFAMFPIILGIIAGRNKTMIMIGIALLGVTAIFQLVTLPVEFDASRRALKILGSENILDAGELAGSKKMLTAAALTYVAALLSTLLNMLRYLAIANSRDRD